jgi:hypothetical protein
VIKKFKLIQENSFADSQKSSTVTALRNLLSAGSVTSNERETAWKNEL